MRLGLMATVFCASCTLSPDARETAALRPVAQVDAYLMAHGMATSYAARADADPSVVLQLARLDMRAASAVQAQNERATAQAVAALIAYAARQDSTDPAAVPAP